MKNVFKQAFTLAEVLIVLSIIGIVASMTIPTLMNKVQNKEFAERFKKEYSIFNSAWTQIIQDNGGSVVGVYSSGNEAVDAICSKMKCIKKCTIASNYNQCFHYTDWKDLAEAKGWKSLSGPSGILADGTSFSVQSYASQCNQILNMKGYIHCSYLYIDTNSFQNPNIMGRDIFELVITQKNILPAGYAGNSQIIASCNKETTQYKGANCGVKILLDGVINY